jgi:ABC-2 type transport system permease protein
MVMLSKLLQKWDIDLAQLKVLLRIAIKLDSRTIGTHYQMAESQTTKYALLWLMFSYVVFGLFFSLLLVTLKDLYTYFFLLCTYTMTMMAMAVLIEFYSIILYPDDMEILGPQPVSSRTYFIAKLLNLGFYIAILTTALCAVPIVATVFQVGVTIFMAPLVYLVFLAVGLVSAFLIIYVYTYLMTRVHHEKLQTILSYVQMLFSFIVFGGYQLINVRFGSDLLKKFSLVQFPLLWLTPMAWFAGSCDLFFGNITWLNIGFAIAAIGLTILFANLGIRRIAMTYSGAISAQQVVAIPKEKHDIRKSWTSQISNFISKPDMRVGFTLFSLYLKRDRKLRMTIIPLFGMLIFYYFYFYYFSRHQMVIADVFTVTSLTQISSNIVFFIFIPIFTSSTISVIRLSTDWQASWIYYTSPIQPSQLYSGAYLAAIIWIVFPLWLVTTVLFSWSMPLTHAIIQTIIIFILSDYIAVLNHLLFPYLPLSAPLTNTGRQGRFLLVFAVSLILSFGILGLEYFAFQTSWGTILLLILLAALSMGLHYLENRRIVRAYQKFEFIEQSA